MVLWRQILFKCVAGRKNCKFLVPKFNSGSIQTMALKSASSCYLNDQKDPEEQGDIPSSQMKEVEAKISQKMAILKSIDLEGYGIKILKITADVTAELNHSLKLVKEIEVGLDQDLKAIRESIQLAKELLQGSQIVNENKLKLEHDSSKQKPIYMLNKRRCGAKNKSDLQVWDDEEFELDPRFEDPCLEESSKFMDQMLQASVSNYGTTKKAIESIFDCAEDSLRTGPSDVDFGLSLEEADDLKLTSGYYTGSSRRHKERSSVLSNEGNAKKPAKPILSANEDTKGVKRPQKNSAGSFDGVSSSQKFSQSQSMVCYKCGAFGHKAAQCFAPAQSIAKGKLSGGNNIAVRSMVDRGEAKLSDSRREIRYGQTSRGNSELNNDLVKCSKCGRTNHRTEDCRDFKKRGDRVNEVRKEAPSDY